MNSPEAAAPWGDLWLRGLSALVLIPAVLLDVWYGGIWFMLFAALLGILMASEWTNIAHGQNSAQFALHATAALCGAFLPLEVGNAATLISILIITICSGLLAARSANAKSVWAYLGVPYVALPAFALVMLRDDPAWGTVAIIWVLVVVWSADTFAYFAGRIIGGPKLAPRISPKKTWAGLGGAIAGSAVASGVIAAYAAPASFWPLVILAGLLAIVEQAGDLFESSLKRRFGVKDSGRLIPGHGGVIDRVDGLVAVAMCAALIAALRGAPSISQGLLLW
jgi:phosphatidate cytidylyltransferase